MRSQGEGLKAKSLLWVIKWKEVPRGHRYKQTDEHTTKRLSLHLIGSEVAVPKIANSRKNMIVISKTGINCRGHNVSL